MDPGGKQTSCICPLLAVFISSFLGLSTPHESFCFSVSPVSPPDVSSCNKAHTPGAARCWAGPWLSSLQGLGDPASDTQLLCLFLILKIIQLEPPDYGDLHAYPKSANNYYLQELEHSLIETLNLSSVNWGFVGRWELTSFPQGNGIGGCTEGLSSRPKHCQQVLCSTLLSPLLKPLDGIPKASLHQFNSFVWPPTRS